MIDLFKQVYTSIVSMKYSRKSKFECKFCPFYCKQIIHVLKYLRYLFDAKYM